MRLVFTPFALGEIDDILDYLGARSPSGARRVQQRLADLCEMIARNPEIGQQTSNRRLRRLPMPPFPYLIFYEVQPDAVVVIGVRHAARDPESMPDR